MSVRSSSVPATPSFPISLLPFLLPNLPSMQRHPLPILIPFHLFPPLLHAAAAQCTHKMKVELPQGSAGERARRPPKNVTPTFSLSPPLPLSSILSPLILLQYRRQRERGRGSVNGRLCDIYSGINSSSGRGSERGRESAVPLSSAADSALIISPSSARREDCGAGR